MKLRLTKTFPFEMAHALYGYDGACKNIHGHSYSLSITVIGDPLEDPLSPKNGMVMDFSELKKIIQDKIISDFDHALVLNGNSPHRNIQGADEHFEKIILVPFQPTCENLLIEFRNRLSNCFPGTAKIHSMALHETASSYAEWFAADNSI